MIVAPQQAPPVHRWLAHLVRASESANSPSEPLHEPPPLDVPELLALARRERVTPLLHSGIANGRVPESLPESLRSACEADYYRSLRANIVALKKGGRILEALRSAGVAAAPLGGWSILSGPLRFHSDPGTRSLEKLELMICESTRLQAESVLGDLGYQPISKRVRENSDGNERAFQRDAEDRQPPVELRWVWDGSVSPARRVGISGSEFLDGLCDTTVSHHHRPTRFAVLASAALRAASRESGHWMRLDDIHRIVTALPVDWDEVVTAARHWRVSTPVYAGLVAARELIQTPVPRDVLDRLAPGPVRRRLLHRSLAVRRSRHGISQSARAPHMLLAENWWDLARAAARSAASRSAVWPFSEAAFATQLQPRRALGVVPTRGIAG